MYKDNQPSHNIQCGAKDFKSEMILSCASQEFSLHIMLISILPEKRRIKTEAPHTFQPKPQTIRFRVSHFTFGNKEL